MLSDCHNIEVNLAILHFCGYYQVYGSGVCLSNTRTYICIYNIYIRTAILYIHIVGKILDLSMVLLVQRKPSFPAI